MLIFLIIVLFHGQITDYQVSLPGIREFNPRIKQCSVMRWPPPTTSEPSDRLCGRQRRVNLEKSHDRREKRSYVTVEDFFQWVCQLVMNREQGATEILVLAKPSLAIGGWATIYKTLEPFIHWLDNTT